MAPPGTGPSASPIRRESLPPRRLPTLLSRQHRWNRAGLWIPRSHKMGISPFFFFSQMSTAMIPRKQQEEEEAGLAQLTPGPGLLPPPGPRREGIKTITRLSNRIRAPLPFSEQPRPANPVSCTHHVEQLGSEGRGALSPSPPCSHHWCHQPRGDPRDRDRHPVR